MKSWKLSLAVMFLAGASVAIAEPVPPGTEDEIRERLQPFGELCRPGDACASSATVAADGGGGMSGEQVYSQFCGTCHAAGVAGAPVLGEAAAWEPRLAKGMDTLWDHTLNGFNAMPPKGTCMACSDDELRAAMEYMVDEVR